MDAAKRSKLEKLLGMLGSSFDGERANAARIIAAMADKEKVTIAELVLGQTTIHREYKPRREGAGPKKREGVTVILAALKEIATADDLEFTITAWEEQFCADVGEKHSYDYELSEKQLAVAQRIIDKVEKFRQGAAAS